MKNNKKKKPNVSIIIPIYNVQDYLAQCLESVIAQTLKNIEIICVNDGSTDESLNILKQYAQKDDRIVVITGPNGGYGHAINKGIEVASGKYIGIVESDDFILPEMYDTLFAVALANPELDIIKSDAIRFYGKGKQEDCSHIPVCKNELYNRVISIADEPDCYNAYMINTTGIYKRELFVQNKIRLNESKGAAYQDNGLWFQLFTRASKIMFINQAFYMYRMDREDSSTNCTTFENALCIFGEWKYIYNILKSYSPEEKKKYMPIYTLRCFGSYYYHFTRVLEEYKFLFLKKFSEEMNFLMKEGDLCVDLLKPYQCDDLFQIIENPSLFYYKWCNRNMQKILDEKVSVCINSLNQKIIEKSILNQDIDDKAIKVSIIVPVFNAEKTISQCLKSVLSQSLREIEIICVDDGSTDKSFTLLLLYSMQDHRIVLRTQRNAGAGVARNEGLKIAKGEFIAFMDPDDMYPSEDVLECLYSTAIDNRVNICGGNTLIVDAGSSKRNAELSFEEEGLCYYKDWQKSYGYYQFIYKREFLQERGIVFPAYRRFQDPPFFVKAMVEANEFYVINKDVYQYNFEPNHVNWNVEKIRDLIGGITDCLKISREKRLSKLHYETLMLLEKSFLDRIVKYANQDYGIIRKLSIAEAEIDVELIREYNNKILDEYKLTALNNIIDGIKRYVPKGYIGPNGFKEYMGLKNECCLLKMQILEVQTSISYRIGMFFSGGKKRAICRGEWVENSRLNKLGIISDINRLQKDKEELEQILYKMRTSKIIQRGLKLTAIFRIVHKG